MQWKSTAQLCYDCPSRDGQQNGACSPRPVAYKASRKMHEKQSWTSRNSCRRYSAGFFCVNRGHRNTSHRDSFAQSPGKLSLDSPKLKLSTAEMGQCVRPTNRRGVDVKTWRAADIATAHESFYVRGCCESCRKCLTLTFQRSDRAMMGCCITMC